MYPSPPSPPRPAPTCALSVRHLLSPVLSVSLRAHGLKKYWFGRVHPKSRGPKVQSWPVLPYVVNHRVTAGSVITAVPGTCFFGLHSIRAWCSSLVHPLVWSIFLQYPATIEHAHSRTTKKSVFDADCRRPCSTCTSSEFTCTEYAAVAWPAYTGCLHENNTTILWRKSACWTSGTIQGNRRSIISARIVDHERPACHSSLS